jgi:hypothetical protein
MVKEVSTDGNAPTVLNRGVDSFDPWGLDGHPETTKESGIRT